MADEDKRLRISGPGSGRRGARVVVRARREGAKLADPTPDTQGTDITGGWEDASVANLRVNRAGTHLEGWLLDYRTKQITEIAGDLQGQEIFEMRDSPNGSRLLGTLHIIDDRELRFLRAGQPPLLLRRVDREPGLSDNALRAFPPAVRDRIREEQRQIALVHRHWGLFRWGDGRLTLLAGRARRRRSATADAVTRPWLRRATAVEVKSRNA